MSGECSTPLPPQRLFRPLSDTGRFTPLPARFEFILLRLPLRWSGPRTAHSSSWAASTSIGTNANAPYHPCVFLRSLENLENRAALDLELFVIRAFGKDYPAASSHVQSSPDCQFFLPIASIGEIPSTPAAFGRPLVSPGFVSKLPSWLLARKITVTVIAETKMFRRFSGHPQLPDSEFHRIQCYMNPFGNNNANITDDFDSHGTGSNSRTKSESTLGSSNWSVYPQTNLPGAKGPAQQTQDNSLKARGGDFKSLVYDLEDPDASYSTPDIAEFIRLDDAIYEGEIKKKAQAIDNWLGDVENSTA